MRKDLIIKILKTFVIAALFISCSEEIITPEKKFSFEKLTGSVQGVNSVCINGDGTVAAWSGISNDVRVKDSERLIGHIGSVNSVKLNKSGSLLISGSADHNIKIWDVRTGVLLRTFSEHITNTRCVIFTPDEKSVVSAEGDYLVYWINGVSGFIGKLPMYGHTGTVTSVAMTKDMKKIISASFDKTIKIWNAETGELIHSIDAHEETIREVKINPILNQFASCSDDSTIKIWDLASYNLLKVLKKDMGEIKSISYHYTGNYIAEGGDNHKINIWDLNSDSLILSLEEHEGTINSIMFSPEADDLISGDSRDKVIIWRNVFSEN